ncbi:MAG: hypothetical protein ABIX44_09915 [Cryobacterium sp.]
MSSIAPEPAYVPTTAQPAGDGALAVTSLVLGLLSIFAGWTFLVPLAGLTVGILSLRREPQNRTVAIWGIVLNAVVLAGVVVLALLLLVAIAAGLAVLPFAFSL